MILDIRNVSDALSRLDDDEKGIALTDTLLAYLQNSLNVKFSRAVRKVLDED